MNNKTYAILVSVDNYKSEDISDLSFCNNDLKLIKNCMFKNLKLPKENILILGEEPNSSVTRSEILRAINFSQKISKDINTLIFYFSGHGTSYNKEGYLVTHDTEIDLPADTSIPISRIINEFKNTNIKNKLLIVDSCYSGIEFSKGIKNIFDDLDDNIELMLSEGWSLMASCKGNELSYLYPEKNASVFTYFLSEAFNILPTQSNKGNITIDEINEYVFKKVAKWSFENKKMQTPNLKSERVGSLTFNLIQDMENIPEIDNNEFSVFEIKVQSKKLILSTSKYFPSSETVRNYSSAVLGNYYPNIIGAPPPNEYHTISYTNEKRLERIEQFENDFLKHFFADALCVIKPSQIVTIDQRTYSLPFCQIDLSPVEDYTANIVLTFDQTKIDEKINEFLRIIDSQTEYSWKSLKYSFNGNFDFDDLTESLNLRGYLITEFKYIEKTLTVKYGKENENLNICFQNKENEAFIEIERYSKLPKDFFDILPIEKIITDFFETIKYAR
ncbi:MAG: caspase family protein [Bacteroidales bacterium]|nr:caspase family protein [Bacteroidales bacterium]